MTSIHNPEHWVTVYELLEYIYRNHAEEKSFTPQQLAIFTKVIRDEKE